MSGSRWAAPLLAAVGVTLWVDALAGGHLGSGPVGLAVVAGVAFVAGRLGLPPATATAAAATAVLLAVADQVSAPGQFTLANDGVFYAVVVGGPAMTGALIGARARQVGELRARAAELERRRPAALRAARAEETERVERRVDAVLVGRLERVVAGIHEAAVTDPLARLADVDLAARSALAELRDVLGVLGGQPARLAAPAPRPDTGATTTPALDRLDVLLVLACLPLAVESAGAGAAAVVGNVVAATVQGLLLPVVRRRPLAGTAVLMTVATAQTAVLTPVPPLVSWLLPGLLTAYLVGIAPSRRRALCGLAVAVVGVLAVTAVTPAVDRDLDGLAPDLAMGVLTWWAARTVVARERRRAELAATAAELARTVDVDTRLAAAEQRAELTRELHDVGAHALTVVCLQSGAAQRLWDRDRAQAEAAMATLVELADGPLVALGRSLAAVAGADRTAALGSAELDLLAGLGCALGLEVEVAVEGTLRPLPQAVARAAYRVVQEALTNAARHSGRGRVRVEVAYAARGLTVTVTDGGPGRGPAAVVVNGAGIGLRGMRERVEACGGRLEHGATGTGFRVRAVLPLPAPEGVMAAVVGPVSGPVTVPG